ncbi:MAG: lipopolysaccharide heptosyltransferase II [Verrucomicrobiales bacterium]
MTKRILIRGVNWLGDAVMSSPALMAIRRQHPGASIILFGPAKLQDLWVGHPAVDEIISFTPEEGLFVVASKLRKAAADMALIFPNSTRSALEVWKAGIPLRIGYGGRWRWLFLNKVVKRPSRPRMKKRTEAEIKAVAQTSQPRKSYPADAHHAYDYLHLVEAAFGSQVIDSRPNLHVSLHELEIFRREFNIPPEALLLGINAGAEYGPAKRWPVERFIEAACQIGKVISCRWLLFGGKADQSLTSEIETALKGAGLRTYNLAGKTSLRELCAGLKSCQLLLTNDTGPMHVAAALGVPLVVPFGSTSPELTGPGDPSKPSSGLILGQAPCAPCFRRECPIDFRCMRSISVDQVVAEALRQIKAR